MKLATIYKQTKTGATQEWTIEVVKNRYRTISGQTNGVKTLSEWTVCYGKNNGKANATTDSDQAMKEAEAKRKLKLEKDYSETIGDIKRKRHFEPMLAHKWEDRKDEIKYPIYSQPKLDGIRCIVTIDGMYSRNGKEIHSAPHIRKSLEYLFKFDKELVLDGELYADKYANNFNKIVSLVKKTKPTQADILSSEANIEYHVYDVPSIDDTFDGRLDWLQKLSVHFPKCVVLVETNVANHIHAVNKLYEKYVSIGYEGQMLRTNSIYEHKRSKHLLKHKSFVDDEYVILDVCEGEGNRSGTAGYMVFETADGKPFKSNIKGTWEETAEMLKNRKRLIGKQATIKYFNLTPDGIPRFPYVIAIDRNSYE